jgi:hypothetical protein
MVITSKDDTWTKIQLSGQNEKCDISIREFPLHGNRILIDSTFCQYATNTKNIDIICTKRKTICKTHQEILKYADAEHNTPRVKLATGNIKQVSSNYVKIYSVEELYQLVNHNNTDLINKQLGRKLKGKPISGICKVKEVDESSRGYTVDCKMSGSRTLELHTKSIEKIQHLKRNNDFNFSGLIDSVHAKNDFINIKTIDVILD